MRKNTTTPASGNAAPRSRGAGQASRSKRADRPPPGRKPTKAIVDARADAQRIRRDAEADAARTRAEAEEHARRVVLDAQASADGVRAEGMELVSNLRQMGDVLRSNAERLLADIQAIHARMIGELAGAGPDGPEPASARPPADDDQSLAIPDFVSRG